MPEIGDMVRVDWYDIKELSHSELSTKDIPDIPLWPAISYGECLWHDHQKLIISRETIGDERDIQVFPIGCVKSVRRLVYAPEE